MTRPTCAAFLAASLDGFIARPDGGLDWLSRVERPGEDHGYAAFHASVDAVVLGRRTYDAALGFDPWPHRGKRVVDVDGGRVVSDFLAAGLLDELTVSVLPVVLAAGVPLFQPPLAERWLALDGARSYPSGLVQLRYRAVAVAVPAS